MLTSFVSKLPGLAHYGANCGGKLGAFNPVANYIRNSKFPSMGFSSRLVVNGFSQAINLL